MSRRVSLAGLICMAAIWCAVLFAPSLRILLRAQAAPEWPNFLERIGLRDQRFARVLQENSGDARVLAAAIEREYERRDLGSTSYTSRLKIQIEKYDQLIEQFSGEKWLLQNRLIISMAGSFAIYDGEFSDADYHRRNKNVKPWLSRAELLQTLKIAERGARLDSQNSFYDWMRAICFFGLKRDDDAMRALQQGSRKPRFDDGTQRDAQNRVAVEALQSPLLWENRVGILAGMLLRHYSIMRTAHRAALWRGVLAERAGNHKKALEIYGAQMRMARLMQRGSTIFIGVVVGEAMEQSAWGAIARKRNQNNEAWEDREKGKRDLAARFSAYAARHGRSDLAAQALRDVQQFQAGKSGNWFEEIWFGLPANVAGPMFKLQWTNAILLRALALSCIAWLLLSAMLLAVRKGLDLPRASLLDVASSALFTLVACVIVLIATLMSSANWMDFIYWPESDLFHVTENTTLNFAPQIIVWLPLGLTFFYCGMGMLWRGRGSTPGGDDEEIEESFSASRAGRLFSVIALFLVAPLLGVRYLNWLSTQFIDGIIFIGFFAGLLLPILLVWIFHRAIRRFFARRSLRDVGYGLAWCRSTLGALIVAGSAAYFVCALWALPLRREADARMNEYLAKGEVALMRESTMK